MEFLNCPKCRLAFNTFKVPYVFPCGHGMCEQCAEPYRNSLECWICRQVFNEINKNQAIYSMLTNAESTFAQMERAYLTNWCKIIPDISFCVSDASKKLKKFLERKNIPQEVVNILIINSKHENTFSDKELKNLRVIPELAFCILSTRESYIKRGEVPNKPEFYYERYYSVSNDNYDKWRNYYRRAEIESNSNDERNSFTKEAIKNDFFLKKLSHILH